MSLMITFIYVVLIGIIALLLIIMFLNREKKVVEINDAVLSSEELERHAVEVARNHTVGDRTRKSHWLVPRLSENFNFISDVYRLLNSDVRSMFATVPAAEWLLDNFYIIEEQVKDIRRNLSKGYYAELPVLKSGYLKGYPRVYAIALELVSHTDGRIDEKALISFIKAYQSQVILSIGELWAVAMMVRIALIENIRHICEKIVESQNDWHKADELADAILAINDKNEDELLEVIKNKFGSIESITPSLVEHLMQKLRRKGGNISVVSHFLDTKLAERDASVESMTGLEHQLQAARQMSIGNAITSLRLVSTADWTDIFESLSHVENILRQDPSGIYTLMDFDSRDYYRHRIERLSRSFRTSEIQIARKAIECASQDGNEANSKELSKHVGFYLSGKGIKCLERKIGRKPGICRSMARCLARHPASLYLGTVVILTMLFTALLMYYGIKSEAAIRIVPVILSGLVVLVPVSDLVIATVNSIVGHLFRPTVFPKLELKNGIPPEMSTMVIMPTLLPNEKRTKELFDQLEIFYLANKEKNLFFALVGDYKDAAQEELPEDGKIKAAALDKVNELNRRYAHDGKDIFFYFHRHRQFNSSQGRWMGWERKRGAIIEFNELLRGNKDTGYSILSTDLSEIPYIKCVITLDADTNLPMGAARRLIGTMAHPLNRAVVDTATGTVKEGYGLLQPRVSVNAQSANSTLFSRIFAGQGGIDPYTTAVSDVYQDLFGEGIFTGKGIYDVDVFQGALKCSIPDNTVLSHDLLEGCYVRAGLVTDIELIDGYPSRYNSYAMRLHRWVRGDWQLLPWLGTKVRDKSGQSIRNPLSVLCKWKILDNMRRSLLNPSLMLLIILGFGILPGSPLVWLGIAVLTTASPILTYAMNTVLSGNYGFCREKRHSTVICGIRAAVYQTILLLTFTAFQAYLMTDAIARTVCRVLFTRKNLLEWVTAADMEASLGSDLRSFWRRMWISPVLGISVLIVALLYSPGAAVFAGCFLIIWTAAPFIAYRISRPYTRKIGVISYQEELRLRRLARKTWRYFEDFAVECDNYLPPDNYQEDPPKGAAHRTSPTNIGFLLISILAARDLGYIGTSDMADRINRTISTIEKMEKWKGHLYNWYDTVTLDVLRPRYVSTVDSGNFVGYVMVLEYGLREYISKPLVDIRMACGLRDTVYLFNEELSADGTTIDTSDIESYISGGIVDLPTWTGILNRLFIELNGSGMGGRIARSLWGGKLLSQVVSYKKEISELMPYVQYYMHPDTDSIKDEARGTVIPGMPADNIKAVKEMLPGFDMPLSINELSMAYRNVLENIKVLFDEKQVKDSGDSVTDAAHIDTEFLDKFRMEITKALAGIEEITALLDGLIQRVHTLVENMKFTPLFDQKRQLFAIGYNIEEGHLTKSYYDLFASEARQASYIAVARGEIDQKHWFRLGRKLTSIDGFKGLVSWTGTMFEYLMPLLIIRNYENTLLDETYSFVVRNQKKYGMLRKIPWGTSESGYNAFDIGLNYQYKAFGVPGLGLKRGLENDIVVAPYATLLALPIDPAGSVSNIRRLEEEGLDALYGFYEAADYTPSRLQKDKKSNIVKSFMAHHQGMSLISLNNYLNGEIMQVRFHADPRVRSGELLLQEKVPAKVALTKEYKEEYIPLREVKQEDGEVVRTYGVPDTQVPNVHILSNGSYSVMVTNGGSGYSKRHGIAVTRWKEDPRASSGMFVYIQNINSNNVWSATFEPYKTVPERYRVVFSPDKAEFIRKDGNIETHTEITVAPDDNAEIRRVSITNHSQHPRIIEVTSYSEIVLANPNDDAAHPAFSNLFVRTEYVPEYNCLIASRRPRGEKQKPLWAFHSITSENDIIGDVQYETDRSRFIGRNRHLRNPAAMEVDKPLSNTVGAVLDPIMSIRARIKVEPGQTARLAYILAVSDSLKEVKELAEKYHDSTAIDRAFDLSWTRSQIESSYLGFKSHEVEQYLQVIPAFLYPSPVRRLWQDNILKNRKGQPDLWPFGISGDNPVALVTVFNSKEVELVHWALKAHEYWRMKGITVDLVILIDDEGGYTIPLQDMARDAVASSHAWDIQDKPGGVFIRNARLMSEEDKNLFYTAASIIIKDSVESTLNQFETAGDKTGLPPYKTCTLPADTTSGTKKPGFHMENIIPEELGFFNGIGGFDENGREYVIHLHGGRTTPAPWINVISNPLFGCLATESGSGYTWAENSRENKLTPWSNDPVSDPPGEVLYIRDDIKGNIWSITPAPVREDGNYVITHGFGYTVYQHVSNGLEQQLTEFVAADDMVKIYLVSLENISGKRRELSLTCYVRPVMGVNDRSTARYVATQVDEDTGVLLVRNSYNADFPGRVVFIDSSERERTYTGDRWEFIGTNGTLEEPEALNRERLSNNVGAGFDPCAAMQIRITLGEGEEKQLVFLLGQGKNMDEAIGVALRYRDVARANAELDKVKRQWEKHLGNIQVSSPDPSMDILLNGWLLYQVISCRLWARSAFYQSGGAYGFRDQLQDVMAVTYSWPELTRKQILLHACHQFVEGDVQHWWHSGAEKGIRTKYSDDLLWLAYVTADYVQHTGDWGILDEEVGYLESDPLGEHEDERYDIPKVSEQKSTVYEHCLRAVERALRFGEHGIPLMGSGDWNDGMNTVGSKGKGESVWLGWFIYTVLEKFIPLCLERKDTDNANKYKAVQEVMAEAMEKNAWDGSWYRRAYFDDGKPLGSVQNPECRIDSISQSWAAISGAGRKKRIDEAMAAVENYLVDREEGLIKLLTPPFDDSDLQPGYIKGYVPGVRENGGQYTHAAVWVIYAFALMGRGDKAWELFHLINPINHARTPIEYSRYKVEPYVVAADVYAVHPHAGRGGWTWYTGAAGWMYRIGIEHILGVKKIGDNLFFDPCIPFNWNEYKVRYRHQNTLYDILVSNPDRVSKGVRRVVLDGAVLGDGKVHLTDDGKTHNVEVIMGEQQIGNKGKNARNELELSGR